MSRDGWISAALALLLATSLSGKFLVGYNHGATDDQRLADELRQRLTANGFATAIDRTATGPVVHAARGSCRLTARNGDSWPGLSSLFQQRARPFGPLRYLYRGVASDQPPRARLLIDRVAYRFLDVFGGSRPRPVLLAVASAPSCDAVAIDRFFNGMTVTRLAS